MDQFKWNERVKQRKAEIQRKKDVAKLKQIKQRFTPEPFDWKQEMIRLMDEHTRSLNRGSVTGKAINTAVIDEMPKHQDNFLDALIHGVLKNGKSKKGRPDH